jgi:hypothetical protein
MFLKSANDKKKIEEARRKRVQQLRKDKPPMMRKDMGSTVSPDVVSTDEGNVYHSKMESVHPYQAEDEDRDIGTHPKAVKVERKEKSDNRINTPVLDLRNDILKGIIFSEILSEPKSIQNIKRSM